MRPGRCGGCGGGGVGGGGVLWSLWRLGMCYKMISSGIQWLKRLVTDQPTDRPTDQQTDQLTNQQMHGRSQKEGYLSDAGITLSDTIPAHKLSLLIWSNLWNKWCRRSLGSETSWLIRRSERRMPRPPSTAERSFLDGKQEAISRVSLTVLRRQSSCICIASYSCCYF